MNQRGDRIRKIVILFLLFVVSGYLISGTTGKIRGIVLDAQTNQPIFAANVMIQGTLLGAASDINGNFTILNVPPGKYDVKVQMMGYSAKIISGIQVVADRSVNLKFTLETMVVEGEAVVVVAKRDLIQVDVSATESVVTAEQIQNTPMVNRIEDMLTMQAGVSGSAEEGELTLRMADPREVLAMVDGYSMRDFKKGGSYFPVNYGVVEEIKIMRNGYNAEYGQARSGIINVITKDPGAKFKFNIDYQYLAPQSLHAGPSVYDWQNSPDMALRTGSGAFTGDTLAFIDGYDQYDIQWAGWDYWENVFANDMNPKNDFTSEQLKEIWEYTHVPVNYQARTGHNLDLFASGPIKMLPWKSGFTAGMRYEKRPFTYPQPVDFYKNLSFNLKWINTLSASTRLVLNGVYSKVSSVEDGGSQSRLESGGRLSYTGVNNRQIFYGGGMDLVDQRTLMFGARLTHVFSPTSFFEVSASYHESAWEEKRPKAATDGRWFVDADGDSSYIHNPQSGWISPADGNRALGFDALRIKMGHDVWEQSYGSGFTWDDSWAKRYELKASYTNQFHHSHEMKAGLEMSIQDVFQNRIHWRRDNPAEEYLSQYHVKPLQIGGYIQDKIEFKGLVANIGLRLDTYTPNSNLLDIDELLSTAWLTQDRGSKTVYLAVKDGIYPTVPGKTRVDISPRIGVSFPITVTSKIFFNWGHFADIPDMNRLYGRVLNGGDQRVEIFPNSNLGYEKTIAYELGYDQSFFGFLQVHVSAFYKDYRDNAGSVAYMNLFNSGDWVRTYENINWRDVKGVEIEIRKDGGRFISGFLNWYLTKQAEADYDYRFLGSSRPVRTLEDMYLGKPQADFSPPVSRGSGMISLRAPFNWGPKIWGFDILGGTSANFRINYRGPRLTSHPDVEFRRRHPDVRFYTIPYVSTDLRLIRTFKLRDLRFEAYLDVTNFLVSKYRYPPSIPTSLASGGQSGFSGHIAYYDDLYMNGKTNKVGSEDVSDPKILETWRDWGLYRGELRTFTLGLRIKL